MGTTSLFTEGRRRWVQSVLSPPTVGLAKIKEVKGRYTCETPNNDCVRNQIKPCSLCHGDCDNTELSDKTHKAYRLPLVRETVRTIMAQVGLDLYEDITFCPFCLAQLQNLVGLKRDIDRLGERLATKIIGLHTLFSTIKTPSPSSSELAELTEDDFDFMDVSMEQRELTNDVNDSTLQLTPDSACEDGGEDFDYKLCVAGDEDDDMVDCPQGRPTLEIPIQEILHKPREDGYPLGSEDEHSNARHEGENCDRRSICQTSKSDKVNALSAPSSFPSTNTHATTTNALPIQKNVPMTDTEKSKGKRFVCHTCGKGFANATAIKLHLRTHTGEKPYLCHICSGRFGLLTHLKLHLITHLPERERPYPCSLCPRRFADPCNRRRHFQTQHTPDARRFVCLTCKKTLSTKESLRQHTLIHTGDLPFVCVICSKGFSNPHFLREHVLLHSGKKPHVCHICSKGFARKGSLKLHLPTHLPQEERPHPCDQCPRRFLNKAELKRHIRTGHSVNKEKSHVCHICSRGFTQYNYLKAHLKKARHVSKMDLTHSCGTCPLRFSSKVKLRRHINTHSYGATDLMTQQPEKEKPHVCSLCPRRFASKGALGRHIHTHNPCTETQNRASYQCHRCGKGYVTRVAYRWHMKSVHKESVPTSRIVRANSFPQSELLKAISHPDPNDSNKVSYTCQTCGNVFGWKQAFKTHMRGVHWKEEVCQCGVCGKGFQSTMGLWYHSKTCPTRPFIKIECYFCHKVLTSTIQHERHLRNHTLERPFLCSRCGHGHRSWASMKIIYHHLTSPPVADGEGDDHENYATSVTQLCRQE